ncbi:MAG TPA: hypothetical protein PKV96_03045 [Candidatus Saccharimonas sp.]|nr:hypothetical protein [Candidatus Saccharimonas sp.]
MTALTTKTPTTLLVDRAALVERCEALVKRIPSPGYFSEHIGTVAVVLSALEASIARIDREIASLGGIQDAPSPQDTPEWPVSETATAASRGLSCGCANELCCTHLDA